MNLIIDRLVFAFFVISLIGLTWFTLSVVDNHEKWENVVGHHMSSVIQENA